MNVLLKITGLIFVFFSCCACGFYQSEKLKKRVVRLSDFVRAVHEYAQRVRVGTEEVERLLFLCFGEEEIRRTENGFSLTCAFMKKEDEQLAREFFCNIGMGSAEEEYERAKLYTVLFSERRGQAEKDAQERCRLMKTLGVSVGCFLCIFLL